MAREMKYSGVTWIGEIPHGWKLVKVKYVSNIASGTTPASNIEDYWDGEIRWITPADFKTSEKWIKTGRRNITEKGRQASHLTIFPTSSVIFSKRAPIGQVGITTEKLCINQGCLGCITNGIISPTILYYLLSVFTEQFELLGSGTTFKEISATKFASFSIPLPPFSEQKAIADFLDKKCAEIDGLLADLEAEVKTLAEYKKSIIAETVTRGLNPNAPTKQSGIPWAETIPAHWEMFRLRFVVQIVSDYKNSSSIKVGLENIESWTGKYIPSETEFEGNGNYFGNNDILFGKLRPYLAKVYLAEFEGQAIGDFLVFRTKECAVPKYVKYFLLNPLVIGLINSFTYGAKMPRANWQDISKVFMPIPPIEEQEAIAAYLDEKCAAIDQSIADKQTQIETLKAYKSSLIYEYVTGKKQVI